MLPSPLTPPRTYSEWKHATETWWGRTAPGRRCEEAQGLTRPWSITSLPSPGRLSRARTEGQPHLLSCPRPLGVEATSLCHLPEGPRGLPLLSYPGSGQA